MREALEAAIFERPELFDKTEQELHAHLRELGKTPNPTDNRLRMGFWREYELAQSKGYAQINVEAAVAGICTRQLFYERYLKIPEKLAWLMCPTTGYMVKAEEALEFGIDQMRDLLDRDHIIGGKVDTKLAELKLKIVLALEARVKGAVVQKQMNLHAHLAGKEAAVAIGAAGQGATMEDLQKQLKELERKTRQAQNLPLAHEPEVTDETTTAQVIEVEATPVERPKPAGNVKRKRPKET
jgi:hypothetical protein